MALTSGEAAGDRPPLCAYCGEVIGVYEALVHVVHGLPEKTSRAAQPGVTSASQGPFYHWTCYGLGDPPAS
jgi:hypothetical protein